MSSRWIDSRVTRVPRDWSTNASISVRDSSTPLGRLGIRSRNGNAPGKSVSSYPMMVWMPAGQVFTNLERRGFVQVIAVQRQRADRQIGMLDKWSVGIGRSWPWNVMFDGASTISLALGPTTSTFQAGNAFARSPACWRPCHGDFGCPTKSRFGWSFCGAATGGNALRSIPFPITMPGLRKDAKLGEKASSRVTKTRPAVARSNNERDTRPYAYRHQDVSLNSGRSSAFTSITVG